MGPRVVLRLASCLSVLGPATAWARRGSPNDADGCAACAGCGGVILLLLVGVFVANIAILVWVARDAKARGMDTPVLWMILVMFLSVFGLLLYVLSRPKGNVVSCTNCGNRRLEATVTCPNCGASRPEASSVE